MRHIHLFEFTDLSWYPPVFRRIQTDYLQFVATRGAGHQNLIPLFKKLFEQAGTCQVLDLCSGRGGPWVNLYQQLLRAGIEAQVTLSDKFPSLQGVAGFAAQGEDGLTYLNEPVDALHVPAHLPGVRTLFEGFHHFNPADARQLLQDALQVRAAIGIFEASLKGFQAPFVLLLSPLMTLLGYLFATPFIRPLTWWRLVWTYLLPLAPLATCWDGLVSFLRAYSPADLRELVQPLQSEGYHWEIGQAPTGTPLFTFTYLLGYPV